MRFLEREEGRAAAGGCQCLVVQLQRGTGMNGLG